MRALLASIILLLASQTLAAPKFESAQAYPGETYEQARARHARKNPGFYDEIEAASSGSAYAYKQNVSPHIDFSVLPLWVHGADKLEKAFQRVRDARIYTDANNRKRRATWLYPIDGCYTRAAHDRRGFERLGYKPPGKVFAFGTWATLRAKTPFAPNGKAWWGFHTAAAYRLGNRAIVLDAAIDPNRLLPFEEWVALIAPDPSKISVSVCDSNAYAPSQTCRGGSNQQDYWAKDQLSNYLDDEWRNLVDLGYDPNRLLGDFPPWKTRKTQR